jgi:hypothetical protein
MIKIDMVSQLKKPALKLNTPEKSLTGVGTGFSSLQLLNNYFDTKKARLVRL